MTFEEVAKHIESESTKLWLKSEHNWPFIKEYLEKLPKDADPIRVATYFMCLKIGL